MQNVARVLQGMLQELEERYRELANPPKTLYIGGGTPSVLSATQLEQIIDKVNTVYQAPTLDEVTIELNPEDVNENYLASLISLGFNRISLGVQSFQPDVLRKLNRLHTPAKAIECLEAIASFGFVSYSVDMIYGIPGQSTKEWMQNLNTIQNYRPPHLSAYALTLEPHTQLYNDIKRGKISDVDEDELAEQYDVLVEWAEAQGYQHYEVSSFALPGARAIHNSNYWKGRSYLGLGPGAHSYTQGNRKANIAGNSAYLRKLAEGLTTYTVEELSILDQANETIMINLRRREGLNKQDMLTFTFLDWDALVKGCAHFPKEWFYQLSNDRIALTDQGMFFSDRVISSLFIV